MNMLSLRVCARLGSTTLPLGSLLAALALTPTAHAAVRYWDGVSGNWSSVTTWSTAAGATTPNPAAFPGALDDTIFNITTANAATSAVSLGGSSRAANSLTFNTTGTTNFRAGGNSSLNLNLSVGAGGITKNATSGIVTIGQTPSSFGKITAVLSDNQTWTNNGTGLLEVVGNVTKGGNSLTIDGSANTTIGGIISSDGGLTKNGAGTLTLNGTYVWELNANSEVTGFETVSLTAGSLALGAASVFEIKDLAGVNFADSFWTSDRSWSVVNNTGSGALTGTFSSIAGTTSNEFGSFSLAYDTGAGANVLLQWSAAIPEPSAFAAIAGLGVFGLAAARRRRA